MRETLLAEVYPHEVSFLEDHLLLVVVVVVVVVVVDVVGVKPFLFLECRSCFLMYALDVVGTLVEVHVDALV